MWKSLRTTRIRGIFNYQTSYPCSPEECILSTSLTRHRDTRIHFTRTHIDKPDSYVIPMRMNMRGVFAHTHAPQCSVLRPTHVHFMLYSQTLPSTSFHICALLYTVNHCASVSAGVYIA